MLSTKEELYLYLEKISRGYALKDLKYFTANHISESLNISRNLASQLSRFAQNVTELRAKRN